MERPRAFFTEKAFPENELVWDVFWPRRSSGFMLMGLSTPLADLYSHSLSFDKHATSLDDVNAFFPITRLHEQAAEGRIGSVASNAIALFNAYSQRRTREVDAPEVLAHCRADAVDAALLVPV